MLKYIKLGFVHGLNHELLFLLGIRLLMSSSYSLESKITFAFLTLLTYILSICHYKISSCIN